MKILFFEIEPWEEEQVSKTFTSDELIFIPNPLNSTTIPQEHLDADIISIFVCSNIDKTVINAFKNLKLLITRSTGYDHIDIAAAKEKKIIVCNVPKYATITVAEHTFALLFCLSRKICQGYKLVSEERCFSCETLTGFDLYGKTIGIIGMGRIGKHVYSIAKAFGMNPICFDKYPDPKFGPYVSLDELLKQSDVITLHLILNDQTYHILNQAAFSKMKKGVYLLNTARGGLIDTQALVDAIKNKIVAGAGFDVLEDECFVKEPDKLLQSKAATKEQLHTFALNEWLIENPCVIITPHTAFNSHEALERLLEETIDIIKAFKSGTPIDNI